MLLHYSSLVESLTHKVVIQCEVVQMCNDFEQVVFIVLTWERGKTAANPESV